MNIFVFDIETVPDISAGKKIYSLEGLSDEDCANAMFALRREKTGRDFLPLHLQRVVAISIVFKHQNKLKVWSLGEEDASEKEIIQRFYSGLSQYTPTLVSWNGTGFDLPVLHYRAMLHGITAPDYWEVGDSIQSFKWNNYINRYHYRHLDLMDIIAAYQARASAPLDEVATMLGFPGKMGMSGSKVWEQFQAGKIKEIRDYCETDVLNTYCVYLRFELMRGNLNQVEYDAELELLKTYLIQEDKQHFEEFLQHWEKQ